MGYWRDKRKTDRPFTPLCSATFGFTKFLTVLYFSISFGEPQGLLRAQSKLDQISIEDSGRMIWTESGKEVTGFGVNYTVPYAYAYRNGKKMGVDLKEAIDQDVYQFERLGLDLFRVHVWDTEISDTLGNLLQNEHLDLFDYLLAQLKKHHINAIITPIAYWGNGWPEKDEITPGFSYKYGKANCLVNPDAIKAQANYLRQFVNHVNPYLGTPYKNEPSILAFEVCNEPHHEGTPAEVTSFVRRMKDAIRMTGCTKPVFYNVSHKIHLADAYFAAGIDGGTFQWYPTGLGFQKELGGNMLPNVDRYAIPFDDVLKKNHAARIVYEFDAADMAKNYLYPAMARSFRTAGIQLATHFAWDPTFTAPYNTEYNTHFMNLLYAPQKALSLMICGEIFRTIPMYSDYGGYPDNTRFGPFHVSYEDNLAEMVTEEKFIYTNNTTSRPPAPEKLDLIAGWGNSSLIEYDGTGAYFLDKAGDQIWRLEIMPDAVQVDNLFGRNSLDKVVAVIQQNRRKMKFNLPGFENGFSIESVNGQDSIFNRETKDGTVNLKPGIYLLMSSKYQKSDSTVLESKKKIALHEFDIPASNLTETKIIHHPIRYASNQSDIEISAEVISNQQIDSVVLTYKPMFYQAQPGDIKMKIRSGSTYTATISAEQFREGNKLFYEIAAYTGKDVTHYLSGRKLNDYDIAGAQVQIKSTSDPISLFDANYDIERMNWPWRPESGMMMDSQGIAATFHIKLDGLIMKDNENPNAIPIADYSIRHFFGDLIEGRKTDLSSKDSIVLRAQAKGEISFPLQVALIMKDNSAFGGLIQIDSIHSIYSIRISDLSPIRSVLLPRPYPTFLPYYSAAGKATPLDLNQIESLEISIGPGIKKEDWGKTYELMISQVWLE